MCGIAGIVTRNGPAPRGDLEKMLAAAEHRGPDGVGMFAKRNIVLGHRRLAIIDLSRDADQPMTLGECTLTFNGEIYNYLELRSELVELGHSFKTTSDTEVLLAAYLEWGQKCVERLDGMWAFAIYDSRYEELFLSRDRFGEKPLIYHLSGDRLVFASEPKQLRAIGFGLSADLDSVIRYLTLDLKAHDRCFYDGLRELPPATNATFSLRDFDWRTSKYYEPDSRKYDGILESDIPDALEFELQQSIDRRLRSDVAVGLLLSGGIDSSLIASIAGPHYLKAAGSPLLAITSSTGDPSNDESRYARSVAESCGLEWIDVDTGTATTQGTWAEATVAQDQPLRSTSVVAGFNTLRAASAAGVTVLLSGQGADESWLGYHKYVPLAAQSLPLMSRWQFLRLASQQLSTPTVNMLALGAYFRSPRVAVARNWIRMRQVGIRPPYIKLTTEFNAAQSSRMGVQEFRRKEVMDRGLQQILQHEDRNSMAFSLESRLPFLSPGMVELGLSVPLSALFRNGWSKWPLRAQLSRSVAPNVAWRKSKLGFDGHTAAFDPEAPAVLAAIASSRVLRELGLRPSRLSLVPPRFKWRLFSVALWEECCVVQ